MQFLQVELVLGSQSSSPKQVQMQAKRDPRVAKAKQLQAASPYSHSLLKNDATGAKQDSKIYLQCFCPAVEQLPTAARLIVVSPGLQIADLNTFNVKAAHLIKVAHFSTLTESTE